MQADRDIRRPRFEVSGNRIGIAAILGGASIGLAQLLSSTTGSAVLVIGSLAFGAVGVFVSFIGFRREGDDGDGRESTVPREAVADLEHHARIWMRSDPLLWPSNDDFPEGAGLAEGIRRIGAPPDLSDEAPNSC